MFKSSAHFLIGCLFPDIRLYDLLVYFADNPLSVASFAIIFSHSEGYVFISFIVLAFISFEYILRNGVAELFEEPLYYFPQSLSHFTFPPTVHKISNFPYPCQYLFSGTFK